MWQARFYQSLPRIVADYPDARWMFLTLTVRNCAIGELGETLNRMNAGFQRLKDRKEFSQCRAGYVPRKSPAGATAAHTRTFTP